MINLLPKITMKNPPKGCLIPYLILWNILIICYIINIYRLFQCDFKEPYKEEIIHLIGVFIPPLNLITVWF